jgi:ATP dependent DNA ligase-like protein
MFDLRGPQWAIAIVAVVVALLAVSALGWLLWPRPLPESPTMTPTSPQGDLRNRGPVGHTSHADQEASFHAYCQKDHPCWRRGFKPKTPAAMDSAAALQAEKTSPACRDEDDRRRATPTTARFGRPLELSRVHWVRPELVAEVRFLTWNADGLLRHVVYEGLRDDKSPRDVRRTG